MATYNQILNGSNNQKKNTSTLVAQVNFGTQAVAQDETVLLANLPANAVITNAFFEVVGGVTGATATGKITVGSTDVIPAVAFAGVDGAIKGGTVTRVGTGTGAEAVLTVGTANATSGVVNVIVEYIETTKVTGELTTV